MKRLLAGMLVILCLVAAGLWSPARAQGRTYYVATTGSDATGDGSLARPWGTPGYGSRQLRPGDTLIILGGRYVLSRFDDDILIPPSGTANAWVTIRGEEGQRPVLAGRDNLFAAVILAGANYVRVENLEITHDDQATGPAAWFRTGISITGAPASRIVLKDLYVHHIDEGGLDIQDVDDLQVLDSRFEYCGFGAILGPAGEHGGVRNLLIRGCTLSYGGHYYQGGDGSNRPYDRPDGFGIEPSDGPITIEDTVAAHNYGDGLDSKSARTTIRRCVVANNSCDGVKLWGGGSRVENTLIYGRGDGDPTTTPWAAVVIGTEQANATFEFVNVTVDDTLGHNYLMHVQYDTPNVPVVLILRNGIWRGADSPIYVAGASTVIADRNLFYFPGSPDEVFVHGGTTYTSATIGTLGVGSLYGDPRFVARAWGADGDYHLLADSPAVDAGTPVGAPPDDLDGSLRPVGDAPDLGAYERQQGVGTVPLVAGWNLASIPVVPESSAITDVLQSIADKYAIVHSWDAAAQGWRTYNPALPPEGQTLLALDERTAFWILMTEPAALAVRGTPPLATSQALRVGWNLVAYPSATPRPVADALASIAGKYSIVWGYHAGEPQPWKRYNPSASIGNDLANLEPGRGYWVRATQECALVIE
ncbi:MAG: right-handed parallel beta-helix repeat-containing protein [Chloroflexi bacterium]|nr:right-handed parallel beta-helix repeat-containing protein [Chloroflexota bacterium]